MLLTFIHDGYSDDDLGSYIAEIAQPPDCALVPCNLEIAQIPIAQNIFIILRVVASL